MTGISFIICASKLERSKACRASIELSVGDRLPCEFVVIDNRKNTYDIFSAYTKGAQDAGLPILAFVHDDVEFLSNSHWLSNLQRYLDRDDTGLVGVAGSQDFTLAGRWWNQAHRLSGAVMHTDGKSEWVTSFGPFGRVAVVDGVVFFIRKATFDAIGGYKDSELTGWHFYDIDLSIRAHLAGYKNYTMGLMVRHGSVGEIGADWEKSRRQWLAGHEAQLPIHLP